MKRFYFALSVVTLLFTTAIAQVSPRWTSVFQGLGDNSDRFNKIIPDGEGHFIGVGYTIKKGNYKDLLVAKFDSTTGDTLWWRTKNGKGNGDDEAVAAGIDAGGNVYITGYVDAGNPQDNIITMKFNSAGDVLWDTTWDSPAMLDDDAVDLKIDGNGNCIVGGNTKPDTVSGNRDFVILKYSPAGQLLFQRIWSRAATGKDELAAIAIDNSNQIYATGRSFGSTDDFILLQIDGTSGSVLWQMPYNGGGDDRAVAVKVDNAGNIVIAGSSYNGSDLDYRINKYNNAGLLQWTRSLSAPASNDEKPSALVIDAADNIYVTGYADDGSSSVPNNDFQTVKYNSAGVLQWVRREGNTVGGEDDAADLTVDANGNVYVTGKSDQDPSPSNSNYDYMTVAYTAAGSLLWGPVYHAGSMSGKDDGGSSLVYLNGSLYVTGYAVNNLTQKDATTIKYDANAGTETWVKDLNGSGDFSDDAKAIVVDANNISYVSGSSFMQNNNLDACIAKIDNAGTLLCEYQYSGVKGDDDEFKTIALSPSGMIYAAGYTKVTNQKSNMLLVKWNPNTGNCNDTVWTRTYDYIGQSDKIEAMVLDNTGNIYVAGRSDANPIDTIDNNDIVTIKYDSNGNVLWLKRFDGSAHLRDEPVKIMFDNAGDVIVGGRTENIHDDDFIILKYSPVDGSVRPGFPVTYGGPFSNDDRVTDFTVDSANDIYVAGYSQTGSGNATQDPAIIAYDAAGNILSSIFYIYSSSGQDEFTKIQFDAFGDLYVLNKYTDPSGSPLNFDYVLSKFHADMTPIWSKSYDSPIHANDSPVDMAITPSGDVYITGTSGDNYIGLSINQNWVTLGYDSAGNQIFFANANGPNSTDDSPNALVIRGTTIWVCGATEGLNNSQKDLTVISYDLPLNTNNIFSDGGTQSVAYPNPFSENCRLTFTTKAERNFQLYDMLGNKVMSDIHISGDELNLSRGSLAAGMYQYKISDSKSIITGKLVIN